MTRTIAFAALLALTLPASSQSRVGTTAGGFLEIASGARYIATGESAVATADDAGALFWNPAGITNVQGGEVQFQHTEWVAGTRLEYLAGVIEAGGGTIGAHVYLFDSGEMDVTTVEFEDGTGETFAVQDVTAGLSYARRLTDAFNIGGTVKFVSSSVYRSTATAFAADIGVQYRTPFDDVTLGFGIFNFGTEMQLAGDNTAIRTDFDPNTAGDNDGVLANLATQSWDLPLLFRIGLAYDALQTENVAVRVSSDAFFPNSNNQYVNVGAEVTLLNMVHLRGGLANLFLDDTFGQGSLRLGAGVEVGGRVRADYAFADRGDLGSVSTIGASFQF
ncbi:PorV/PorQ family protein [Rubrivirga sp.]|uniref:PorV/PorQ family protein n=1 Tax=Rubrivirga sp. TaxID=1885344 RepID=UPI003C7313BD